MRRYSPQRYNSPRRGYGGRGRSPPRRGYGGFSGRREESHRSLLVRNVPLNCRPEDLRIAFERFGPIRDVYLPKDYYTGEPRGFAFVEFINPYDASDAQYHMNGRLFGGREITVVAAAETRKRPEEMRTKTRPRGPSGYYGRHSSYYGRHRSRSVSPSRSPHHTSNSRIRRDSRSYSPAPRRHSDHSVSPKGRQSRSPRSLGDHPHGSDDGRGGYVDNNHNETENGYSRKAEYDAEESHRHRRSPRRASRSPPGSRSHSADLSPRRSR